MAKKNIIDDIIDGVKNVSNSNKNPLQDGIETLEANLVPKIVYAALKSFPISVFERIFVPHKHLWSLGAQGAGWLLRSLTRFGPKTDQFITEAAKEFGEKIDLLIAEYDIPEEGSKAIKKALGIDGIVKILQAIINSSSVNNTMELYIQMVEKMNDKDKSQMVEVLSKLKPKEIVSFIQFDDKGRKDFIEKFMGLKIDGTPAVAKSKKKRVRSLSKRLDDMLGNDRLVGSIFNKIFS